MDIIKSIEHEQMKSKIPYLKVGDTVKVHVRVKEGNRERIQVFEGIVIKKQGGGVNATFTVRKTSYGVGVEKTFLIHSPAVEKVEVIRVGKARRTTSKKATHTRRCSSTTTQTIWVAVVTSPTLMARWCSISSMFLSVRFSLRSATTFGIHLIFSMRRNSMRRLDCITMGRGTMTQG